MMKYVKGTFEKQICKNMIELYNEDCLTQMLNLYKQSIKVDHIICDLPYFQVVKNDFDNQWNDLLYARTSLKASIQSTSMLQLETSSSSRMSLKSLTYIA